MAPGQSARPQQAADFETVENREIEVKDDQVQDSISVATGGRSASSPLPRISTAKARRRARRRLDEPGDIGLVLDDEGAKGDLQPPVGRVAPEIAGRSRGP